MEHSEKCLAKQKEYDDRIDEYVAQYPNACRSCNAAGVISSYERVDEIGGYWMNEPCDHCLGQGKCPRCGKDAFDVDELEQENLVCPHCGWNENDGMMSPEFDYPCECAIEEEKKMEEEARRYFDEHHS